MIGIHETACGVSCPAVRSLVQERYRQNGASPVQGCPDGQGTRALRWLVLLSLEERRLRRDFIAVYNYLIRGYREDGGTFFLEVYGNITRCNRHKLGHGKFQLDKAKTFYPDDAQILGPVAQRNCGISILRGVEDLIGQVREWPDPVRPALRRGLDQIMSKGPCPPPLSRFCDQIMQKCLS